MTKPRPCFLATLAAFWVMLVAGSGIKFEERGEHELKGVPGAWRLFGVLD